MKQRWKYDPFLFNCKRDKEGHKKMDYYTDYVREFLSSDPLKDWESIERCKELWNFFLSKIGVKEELNFVLDAGTKDCQFPQWLQDQGYCALGIEIDDQYVDYAWNLERPIRKGDVCNIHYGSCFDVVFSHHVLGLCPSYSKAYEEMLRVCKSNGYIVTLADVPGNPRKHYSMVCSIKEVRDIINSCDISHEVIYMNYWSKKRESELVTILKKR